MADIAQDAVNRLQITNDPASEPLSAEELALLSQIFRLTLKEITGDADKLTLAPGEMGVNYTTGTLWIRNPHNGQLFSPNDIAQLLPILAHYDSENDILDAGTVTGITIYNSLLDLRNVGGLTYTPDLLIREMVYPGIFYGTIEDDNYIANGWPAAKGICLLLKTDESEVYIKYFDNKGFNSYFGRYDCEKHMFLGWVSENGMDNNYIATLSGGDLLSFNLDHDYENFTTVIVNVGEDLNPGFYISVNGSEPTQVKDENGDPVGYTIAANNDIMLMYDEPTGTWTLFDITESVITAGLKILKNNVDDLYEAMSKRTDDLDVTINARIDAEVETLNDRIDNEVSTLNERIDTEVQTIENRITEETDRLETMIRTRPGVIEAIATNYTAASDGIDAIAVIDGYDGSLDKLIVNYGQTILRVGIDYEIVNNGVRLLSTSLAKNDVIQFIILKQHDPND